MSFFGWGKSTDWKGHVHALAEALSRIEPAAASPEELRAQAEIIANALPDQLKALKKEGRVIFHSDTDNDRLSRSNLDFLRGWHSGDAPSLTALCIYGIENMRLNLAPDVTQAVLVASVLGELDHPLPYHNNMHFRKVLLQMLRLISVHNSIYEGTAREFNHNQVALMMIGACIHDLGHDGIGNTFKGLHHPGHVERRSFNLGEPYLRAAGLGDLALADLRVLLLSTDVSPLADPGNYMNQMKAAYRFHFLGERKGLQTLNLDQDLKALQKNPYLAAMSLLLHEADISTSAGLHYDITKYETAIYAREIGEEHARPSHIIEFLDTVCQQRMLSEAAQKLYAANMARIHALAENDVNNGNEPLPRPEHSDLIVNAAGERGSKTVN
jgi:hypothetical protein